MCVKVGNFLRGLTSYGHAQRVFEHRTPLTIQLELPIKSFLLYDIPSHKVRSIP